MPELPEVETVKNSIKKHLLNKRFVCLNVNWKKVLHNFSVQNFNAKIKNKEIADIYRRGKYIIFDFNTCIMAIHLRMINVFLSKFKFSSKLTEFKTLI